jgi:predicted transcriptional regulator
MKRMEYKNMEGLVEGWRKGAYYLTQDGAKMLVDRVSEVVVCIGSYGEHIFALNGDSICWTACTHGPLVEKIGWRQS